MSQQPIADRFRPTTLDEIVGQAHLVGKNGVIRRILDSGRTTNMIFFGPPGTGKTTVAAIIAARSGLPLRRLNATTASIADVRDVAAETESIIGSAGVLLYLDEIQYFNKKQQQTLLEYLEDGRITLIASTTENPYLYVYNAVVSRSVVCEFFPVSAEEIIPALKRALDMLNKEGGKPRTASGELLKRIAGTAAGDVRRALNLLENLYYTSDTDELTGDGLAALSPRAVGAFDRSGTTHYDLLSALQKSIRGSDPDAAIFYLARILEGGDLIGACRRLQVIASEDIGLAYPTAPLIVRACVESAEALGMPEARIPLSHATILLATAPKSNTAYTAYSAAAADIAAGKGQIVPPYMRPSNNFDGYLYPHDYPDRYTGQPCLPEDLRDAAYYKPADNKAERAAAEYWRTVRERHKL